MDHTISFPLWALAIASAFCWISHKHKVILCIIEFHCEFTRYFINKDYFLTNSILSFRFRIMASHSFSGNYMILRPEEMSWWDPFSILCNRDFGHKKMVEFPVGKEENLTPRWLIFISLLGQKVLQIMAKPMLWFGSVFEMGLNILSSNRNIFVLLFRALQSWYL